MPATTRLLLAESARATLTAAAARAHPCETGGILIGVLADGHPWVTTAIEIPTTERGRAHYRIPGGATHAAVERSRATDDRLGYLGDWHTHPADAGPSPTDLATLSIISVAHPRTPNPTQIIVRRNPTGYSLDARRVVHFTPRACRIVLTGDLPPRSADHHTPTPADPTVT